MSVCVCLWFICRWEIVLAGYLFSRFSYDNHKAPYIVMSRHSSYSIPLAVHIVHFGTLIQNHQQKQEQQQRFVIRTLVFFVLSFFFGKYSATFSHNTHPIIPYKYVLTHSLSMYHFWDAQRKFVKS